MNRTPAKQIAKVMIEFLELKKAKITKISEVFPWSNRDDANACFTIYTDVGYSSSCHTSSIRKANLVIKILKQHYKL